MPGYFEFGYFNLAFAGASGGAATDLLQAIYNYFESNSLLIAAFPGGFFDGIAPNSAAMPCVELTAIDEAEPGETLEDRPIDVTFCIRAPDLTTAKSVGATLINQFDPPGTNSNSTRAPLSWTGGVELYNVREPSKPYRRKGLGQNSSPVWCYDIEYRFWVDTTVP